MANQLKLPDLGENIDSGDVIKILISVGDEISEHQPVLELETDKAVVEVPSSVTGVVSQIHVKEGDNVKVGQPLLSLDDKAGSKASAAKRAPKRKPKQSGERKTQPPRAKAAKTPHEKPPVEPSRGGEVVEFAQKGRARDDLEAPIPAAPSVRRFAREIGVNIEQVQGSGPQGRISSEDVKAFARSRAGSSTRGPEGVQLLSTPLPDFSRWGIARREKFSNVRRKTAEHMTNAWLTIPHVTQNDKCDITALEKRRKQYAARVEQKGGKLTITGIVVKVLASALKVFPQFNASLDIHSQETIYKDYINVGVAVDTPRGLLVPVLHSVDRKNILELSVELQEIASRAREGKVSPEMLQGGTFTVTNLGGIGGTSFSPIVNWPEVAILGLSRARVEPVFEDGKFVPRNLLPLSLSYDHRIIDGADAARFLRWVASALEDPFLLSLEG